jgi:DNA polymerase-3 subunit delta
MMSNYRVVIVKEAQNMKDIVPNTKTETKDDKKHPLEIYIENPQKSTILVFCYKYKTIDMRTSFAKNLERYAVILKSAPLYEHKVPKWIEEYVSEKKYSIEPKASQLLTEYLGNNLSKIANELEKLFLNLSHVSSNQNERKNITVDHIHKYVGISKEYNNFELQDAIGKKDYLKANRIVNYFASNPKDNPMVVTVASLMSYFSKVLVYHTLANKSQNNVAAALKVNPFFVKDYVRAAKNYSFEKTVHVISILREYDMKSKGYETATISEGELMKEMIFKIMH